MFPPFRFVFLTGIGHLIAVDIGYPSISLTEPVRRVSTRTEELKKSCFRGSIIGCSSRALDGGEDYADAFSWCSEAAVLARRFHHNRPLCVNYPTF